MLTEFQAHVGGLVLRPCSVSDGNGPQGGRPRLCGWGKHPACGAGSWGPPHPTAIPWATGRPLMRPTSLGVFTPPVKFWSK